jgi:hypothetical protein
MRGDPDMSNDIPPTGNGAAAEPGAKGSGGRRWPWIVGIVAALFVGYGAGAAGGDETEPVAEEAPEPQPTVTVTETVEDEPSDDLVAELDARAEELDQREADLDAHAAELDDREAAIEQAELEIAEGTIPGDGIFLVGEDIEPGTYRGNVAGGRCYWARLSGTSGDFDDLITNDNVEGPTVVTIAESDVAFETSRCGEWVKQ